MDAPMPQYQETRTIAHNPLRGARGSLRPKKGGGTNAPEGPALCPFFFAGMT
jgi:hypothetical protein